MEVTEIVILWLSTDKGRRKETAQSFVTNKIIPSYSKIITFLIQKHFKTETVTVNLGKINSNYLQDGNWESMEMKG